MGKCDSHRDCTKGYLSDDDDLCKFLRGLVSVRAKAVDTSFVNGLNFWSESTRACDIQRNRDVGTPSYNDVREEFGLSRAKSYEDLTGKDSSLATILQNLY